MSIIDKELTVEGMVSFKGQLIVKGSVKGNLYGDLVVIAEGGSIQAQTTVSQMTIGGIFEGELSASEKLTILSTGKCSGKITCRTFEVESGGVLNAEVNCKQTP
jgi:cytoskeletal protein CcmA (bactofilin family)